jgi:DNA-binding transcriptional ArsR family regulator
VTGGLSYGLVDGLILTAYGARILVTLELDVADLAATRFAMSPLVETARAIPLLARPGRASVNVPWVRWALAELEGRPLRLPRVWPLLVSDRLWWPEFLFPAPAGKSPTLAEELARVCATPVSAVHVSLRNVFGEGEWPQVATDLFERPEETLAEIAAEVAACHDRLIAPHWERLRSVLDADIAYRGGMLAAGGARSLFADLHPNVRWSEGRLLLADSETWEPEAQARVALGPDGLVLVPSVFIWPEWSVSRATSTQTTLLYPARGAATVWQGDAGSGTGPAAAERGAVEALLGAPRARLLGALRSPATTSALARRFGVTPSAVSQHLAVLHRGGLIERQRSGRTVLYQASELGVSLLDRALLRAGGGS